MQFPKLSWTNPLLQKHWPLFQVAFALQVRQEVANELLQVLQVWWQPATIQFPLLCSNTKPEKQVHTPLTREELDLQDRQLVLVGPEQVLQEISQLRQRAEVESKYLLLVQEQVPLLKVRLFLQVRQLEALEPLQVAQVLEQAEQLPNESWKKPKLQKHWLALTAALFLQVRHWFEFGPVQVRQFWWQVMFTQFPELLKEKPELQAHCLLERRVEFTLQLVHSEFDEPVQFSQVLLQLRQKPVLLSMKSPVPQTH
jgi:hypothetical protein